jgi:MYXO-CTERM domain-containing protein
VVSVEEVPPVLKKLALAALAAGALAAVRKRASGRSEADLWHEATQGPDAVSTPTTR